MKISIVTVCYNSISTLEDTILSVLSQNIVDLEYIIIDGGSNDGSIDIIKKFGNQISIVISEPDSGIYDAMNKGIGNATGDIIGILNSDDIYADRLVLSDILHFFQADSELEVLYGNLVYVDANNTNKIIRHWNSKPYTNLFFEKGNVPPHPTFFVTSKVYKKIGLFDLKFSLAADYDFMFRVLKLHSCKSKYIDRLIVKMRLGGVTNNSLKNIIIGNKQILKAWRINGFRVPFLFFPSKILIRLLQYL